MYIIVFYSIWTLWEFFGKQMVDSCIPNEILSQLIKSSLIKNLVWTLPALLLIKHSGAELHIGLREMFASGVNWLKFLPLFALFAVYISAGAFLGTGRLALSADFGMDDIIIVLFAGITEELVFRGWLLNAMYSEDRKWLCIAANAFMFLLIHFPVWIVQGSFFTAFTDLGFLCVLVLSVIFSLSFIRSRSILVPIALHMFWDLLMFMLY